jgi:hypothetical protein
MAGRFLVRGMLCGLIAGVLVFLFARFFGESSVDGAIAVEEKLTASAGHAHEHELVSRAVQASWGLLTGTMVFSVAIGGLYSLVFAFAWGRLGRLNPRATAVLVALGGFVAIYLMPFLKYPANPPSVGNPDTIGYRTALYFGVMVLSIVGLVVAINLGRVLWNRLEHWHAILAAIAAYGAIMVVVDLVLPGINEVPEAFPATLLWQFRIVALGMQVILWTTLGLLFGELTQRAVASAQPARRASYAR